MIIVLGLLAAIVAPQILGRVSDARTTAAQTQVELFGTALDSYRLDNGSYPTTEQGLAALRQRPTRAPAPTNWRGPYLRKDVPWIHGGSRTLSQSRRAHATGYDLSSLAVTCKVGGEGEDKDVIGYRLSRTVETHRQPLSHPLVTSPPQNVSRAHHCVSSATCDARCTSRRGNLTARTVQGVARSVCPNVLGRGEA